MTESEAWAGDHAELLELARALVAAEWLTNADEVLDFMEKPHKWDSCRQAWVTSGRPTLESAGWEMFTARLRRLE